MNSTSKSTEANGTVSVQNNLPNADAGTTGAGSQEARQEETTNYEISKTVRTLIHEQPQIDRISLAVMVDDADSVGADGKHVRQPRSAEELARIATLVKSAIGFDEKRGDQVDVVSMRFADGDAAAVAETPGMFNFRLEKADILRLAQTGLFGLVALLALLFVLRPMVTRLITLGPGGDMGSLPPGGSPLALAGPGAAALLASSPGAQALRAGMSGSPLLEDESMVNLAQIEGQIRASSLRRVTELVDKHPDETLSIVRGWMVQEMADSGKGDDYRNLNGVQKAAMLMLALGEDQCARLFGMMHEDELKDISAAMAQLGSVRAEVVERLCLDFAENMGSAGNLVGSFESTERLLQKALPRDRAAQIMEEIRGPAGRTMWDKLGNVNESVLANYLKNEYPQTVAVVLSKVRADHAARVLSLLPDSFAMEVVMRMLRMESVQKDVLDGVEKTLRAEFMSNLARSTRRDAHEMMADIFNNLDRQSEVAFHRRAGGAQPRGGGADQVADVHLRRPGAPDPAIGADAVALDREGQAADRAERCVGEAARAVPQ